MKRFALPNIALALKGSGRALLLCWVVYAAAYFGRNNLAAALPLMTDSGGFDEAHLGLLGTLFFWCYGIGHLISGVLGDRFSPKRMVQIGLTMAAVSNLAFGLSRNMLGMGIAWACNGLFQSMLWGPMARALTNWFPRSEVDRVSVKLSTSMVAGYLAAWGIGGFMAARFHWSWAFYLPSAFMAVVAAIWFIWFKEKPERTAQEAEETTLPTYSTGVRGFLGIWRRKGVGWLTLACIAQGVIKDGVGLWGPLLILRYTGMDVKLLAGFTLYIPAMNFVGMMFAGWLNRRVNRQENISIIVLFIGAFVSLLVMTIPATPPALRVAMLGTASASAFGANTLLLGAVPMGFAKYGCVSTAVGYFDSVAYAASGLASLIIGILLRDYGVAMVVTVWIAMIVPALFSMMIRSRVTRRYIELSASNEISEG